MSAFFNTGKIDDIISFWSAKRGFQRANRYGILISRPGKPTLETAAVSVQLPARNIEYIEDHTAGPSNPAIRIPIRNYFDDRFIVTFVVDTKWSVRKYIEDWMDDYFPQRLSNNSNASTVGSFQTALGTILFWPLTVNHQKAAEMMFHQVYPKSILPGEMAQSYMDTPLTLTVDFNYRYYSMDATF